MPEGFHNGYKIPEFVEGDREYTPQSAKAMNRIVRAVNVLLNPHIKRGTSDSDIISEVGHTITLKGTSSTSDDDTPGGANPIGLTAGGIGVLIVPPGEDGEDEAWVVGHFDGFLRIGPEFGEDVKDEECKRSCVARFTKKLVPMPMAAVFYNSTWVSSLG